MEARNACKVSGLPLVDAGVLVCAVNERELFFQRHLAQQLIHTRIARNHGDSLRNRSCSHDGKCRYREQRSEYPLREMKTKRWLGRLHYVPL